MGNDKNPFEGVDHSDFTNEEKKKKGVETDAEAEARMSKPKTEKKAKTPRAKKEAKPKAERAPKPKAEKKPRAKKAAKPKKAAAASDRAPRVTLSEKQLSEARETIRILPAVKAMVEKFAKKKGIEINEAADKLITTAWGRLAALERYNKAE